MSENAFPPLTRIRRHFPHDGLVDVPGAVRAELAACGVRIAPGARIALAVGSRGIANLPVLVREIIAWVKAQGGEPFIVPAMGSHGGATAEGQQAVLAGYGITAAAVGAPVRSSMAVVALPAGEAGVPVYCDALAAQADGTIILNRVKPHTSFHGIYESGLMKMLAIGLGKHRQALAIHQRGVAGLREIMPRVARQVLRHGNVLLGVAVVENAHEEICMVRALPAARIPDEEPALLALARARLPGLPLPALDVLIVEEMGKNISGLGIDPNVIGRLKIAGQPEPASPRITVIVVGDLTAETHGNACGMGLADIITRRLQTKIDYAATYENVLTTGFLERGKLPLVAETDAQALVMAGRVLGAVPLETARIIRIKNTRCLEEMDVSPQVLADLAGRDDIELRGPAGALLTVDGNLRRMGDVPVANTRRQ